MSELTASDTHPRDAGRVVIVGAGMAGFAAAMTLRSLGHAGSIDLVDSEPAAYDRPPLSKRLFADDLTLESLAFATPETLAERGIETRFDAAVSGVDASTRAVALADGTALEADTILLATGARARSLPIPGADLPGVQALRTLADAQALRNAVEPGTRVAVIGAGLIGAELASSLIGAGASVTIVDPVPVPLVPAVGEALAGRLQAMHAEHGVHTITGLTESFADTGEGIRVAVAGAEPFVADRVVVGVGIVPNTELAGDAGLETDDGVVVDEAWATSAPGIFAAGDVARVRGSDGALRRRDEHWEAAEKSGTEAAHAMVGLPVPPRGAPWFWSDRYGHHVEAVGRMAGPGDFVERGGANDSGDEFPAVFLIDGGMLAGAAAVDEPMTIRAARGLIDKRVPVTAAQLADPVVNLRKLLRGR